jgi:hypothetical protein
VLHRFSTVAILVVAAVCLSLSWVTTALADADADGLDGDEFGLPIVLGIGALAIVAWLALRGRKPGSPD